MEAKLSRYDGTDKLEEALIFCDEIAEYLIHARERIERADVPPLLGKDELHGRISNAHALVSEMRHKLQLEMRKKPSRSE